MSEYCNTQKFNFKVFQNCKVFRSKSFAFCGLPVKAQECISEWCNEKAFILSSGVYEIVMIPQPSVAGNQGSKTGRALWA